MVITDHHSLYNLDELINASGLKAPSGMTQLYKAMVINNYDKISKRLS